MKTGADSFKLIHVSVLPVDSTVKCFCFFFFLNINV